MLIQFLSFILAVLLIIHILLAYQEWQRQPGKVFPIMIVSAQAGFYHTINLASCNLLGYSQSEYMYSNVFW